MFGLEGVDALGEGGYATLRIRGLERGQVDGIEQESVDVLRHVFLEVLIEYAFHLGGHKGIVCRHLAGGYRLVVLVNLFGHDL